MNAWFSVHRYKDSTKLDSFLPKFIEISSYINYSQFIKTSPNSQKITQPPRTNKSLFINRCSSNSLAENSCLGFNVDSLFYSGFSSNKQLAWGGRCRDRWRVFHNLYFIIIFANYIYQSSIMFLILFFIVNKEN